MEAPKTKEFIGRHQKPRASKARRFCSLCCTRSTLTSNVALSARNLQNVKVVLASNLNTYDVMNAGKLVLSEGSVNVINQMFGQ